MCWIFFCCKKSDSDIIRQRIVSVDRSDIFVQPPIITNFGDDLKVVRLDEQKFTPEFAAYCKQHYSKYISPNSYYIQFSFMDTPHGRTWESDTGIKIVDYTVCWRNCDYGYILSPKNHKEYIPMKQVFQIMCELMDETGKPYVANVQRVKLNEKEWEQDNMILTFMFVQNSKTWLSL